MYEFIRGQLKEKEPLKAVVETHGVAYRLAIPLSTYSRLPAAEKEVLLFLSHVVREDAHTLYGFLSREERNLFETLITLSGIGPKTAQAIIGHIDLSSFERAVMAADTRLLSKIPGIGKKTAERLVIEMRDKFKGKAALPPTALAEHSLVADAVHALLNLGYTPAHAQKAVQLALQEKKEETDLARLITSALQKM
ncbi:MAG: Holliday junction branch migration protein RuvA [Chlamydiia bacterium]|nr:Holliday junction branch migration protein RuvA [Chlamydiia bacterium]